MWGCRFDCAMYASEWIELLPAYICVMMLWISVSVCLFVCCYARCSWLVLFLFNDSMTALMRPREVHWH